jgi:hypothetical protein
VICYRCLIDRPETEFTRFRGTGQKNKRRMCRLCEKAHRDKRRAEFAVSVADGTVELVLCRTCGETKPRGHWTVVRCRDCVNDYHGRWRCKNRESFRATQAKFRAKQADDPASKPARRADARARYAENPEPLRLKSQNRRALEFGAGGRLTAAEWSEILAVFDGRCGYCLERSDSLEKDHVIALTRGGTNDASNIVPACRACNARKKNHAVWHMLRYAS